MEKEKNFIIKVNNYLKENILMEEEMEKGRNMINMANYYLKENI